MARRQRLTLHMPALALLVEGDRARLVQVLSNLLGNAVKYSPDDSAIDIGAQELEGRMVLEVRDEGIGMKRELLDRAFDLFAQAKRSSGRSQGGLGLGLALVRNLAELHGGAVSCASPGLVQGSSFTVTLPLAASPAAQAPLAALPVNAAAPPTLLVVEDNVDAATTMAMLLEGAGHEVFIEHESLRAQPETAHSVMIAVSGYGQEHDRKTALAAGFAHHLVNPVDIDRLMQLLATIRPAAQAA